MDGEFESDETAQPGYLPRDVVVTPPDDPILTSADVAQAFAAKAAVDPQALLLLARTSLAAGKTEDAVAQVRRAVDLSGGDREIVARARSLINDSVPSFHFVIVHDQVRNDAYEAALRRAVSPGMRVLEIGTGSGILALMAARAGARVISCEMNPVIAEAAERVIAANGFSDRVRVIAKRSDKLDVHADLGGPMDLLVSEIVSNNLLSQDILGAHRHAIRALLKPGAPVIPASGRLRIALAESSSEAERQMGTVSGFDLRAFNGLCAAHRRLSPQEMASLVWRSNVADLFPFDFSRPGIAAARRSRLPLTATGGRVNGIAQWIRLHLDGETSYENGPDISFKSCWAMMFHPLPVPIETRPGEEVWVGSWHNDAQLEIWVETRDGIAR